VSDSDNVSDLRGDARFALRGAGWVLWSALGVLLVVWLFSGASRIDAKEVGFVRRFGRVLRRDVESGFTLLLPWPIDRLDTVPAKFEHRSEAGFSSRTRTQHMRIDLDVPPEEDVPYALTGDQNIVHVSLVARYTISEPYSVRYEVKDVETILFCAVNEAILTTLARMPVDDVLTTGKQKLRDDARRHAQKILDDLGVGVSILQLQLETPPTVPEPTRQAFQEVNAAKVGKQTAVNDAETRSRDLLSRAEGEAAGLVARARSYKQARTEQARSDARSFLDVLAEYRKNKRAERLRLYLETMGTVLTRVKVYVLPPGSAAPAPVGRMPPALRSSME
jgi:membrane protease subunit HflK